MFLWGRRSPLQGKSRNTRRVDTRSTEAGACIASRQRAKPSDNRLGNSVAAERGDTFQHKLALFHRERSWVETYDILILFSDNEPALVALKQAVVGNMNDVEITSKESPTSVDEENAPSNGCAECAVREVNHLRPYASSCPVKGLQARSKTYTPRRTWSFVALFGLPLCFRSNHFILASKSFPNSFPLGIR